MLNPRVAFTTLLLTAPQLAVGQTPAGDPLNLGFEQTGLITRSMPFRWSGGAAGYEIALDTVVVQSGKRSLRIRPNSASRAPNAFGVTSTSASVAGLAGKTARFRGYIKTDAVDDGYAGLWMRQDAPGRMLALDNMSDRGPRGTTDWKSYDITMRIDSAASTLIIGALHPGGGTAWFDSLSLEIDGKPYQLPPAWKASAAEVAWVKERAIPIATSDPKAPLDDLRPLGTIVGDARIVSLGEGTHGTSEFFQMKHRLTEYLAREKGFTVFAIEANMPEARRVNEYVLTGRGDPRAALAGMYFWTWNTQEVLDMIEWMRAYNASGKGRIEFWGFDLQTPNVAMDSVRAFLRRADASYMPVVDSVFSSIDTVLAARRAGRQNPAAVGNWVADAARVLSHMQASRDAYVRAGRDTMEIAWAIQNARIVQQAGGSMRSGFSRDSSMAENVAWIAAHQPAGTKMVLWAHNGHVNRVPNWMGAHLADRYGSAMRVIGFALGEGEYTAVGPRGLSVYPAAPPAPGSAEEVFRATGVPRFALDLRDASRSTAGAWLGTAHDFRSIGAVAMDQAFNPSVLARQFDVIIYFDRTTASAELAPSFRR
jgi:erythromycin esterase